MFSLICQLFVADERFFFFASSTEKQLLFSGREGYKVHLKIKYTVYSTGMQSVALFYLVQQSDAVSLLVILLKLYEAAVRCLPRGTTANPAVDKQGVRT